MTPPTMDATTTLPSPTESRGLLISAYRRVVLNLLEKLQDGHLTLTLPDGEVRTYGQPGVAPVADLHITDDRAFRDIVLHGEVGFGEAYMAGFWRSSEVTTLLHWFLHNRTNLPVLAGGKGKLSPVNLLRRVGRVAHWLRRNSIENSRRNIHAHYDLSNDFFKLFLDEGMTYSGAWFEAPEQDLAEAQEAKYRRLAEKVNLKPGQRVLEIGCGWGGFGEFMAREFGVEVVGVTISEEQFAYATERIKDAGLSDRVDIRMCDYRLIEGKFDAIVSVEMLEAVGHQFLADYFAQCHRLLKPDGVLGIQVIISPDANYDFYRKRIDYIQKHIFPGGHLPSIAAINGAINRTGDMSLQHVETFGLHYAETLRRWRETFMERLEEVRQLGFDDIFERKWEYYLAYCEAGFNMRNINLAQLVYARPNNTRFAIPGEG